VTPVAPEGGGFASSVVVGADGSPSSTSAVEWSGRLAHATGATVHLVHVLTYDRELKGDMSLETMHTWRLELEQALRKEWASPLIESAVAHDCRLVEGARPADALLDLAAELEADLVVVGAPGGHGLARRVLGSTIERLAHLARVPVIVVPNPPARTLG
jgi:nucleotide-binding universal stress UspA family protein